MNKQERLLQSAMSKLIKSKDFGSDCVLDTDEANVVHIALTSAANVLRNTKSKQKGS